MAEATRNETAKAAADDAIADAAMRLFAERGYTVVRLSDVAEAAGCDLGALRLRVDGKPGLLTLFLRRTDAVVLGEDAGYDADESVRDRLFDLLMRRFDALRPYRPGLRAVFRDLPRDPVALLCTAPTAIGALGWYLEAAGASADGPLGALRVKGLALVWLQSLRVFLDDDSEDLARTMSALDKALRQAERAAGWIGDGAKRRSDTLPDAPSPAG